MSKKRRNYSPEEIVNDPSLKWFDYRKFECLVNDDGVDVRFVSYEADGSIRVADLASMRILPVPVSALSVRRRTGHSSPVTDADRRAVLQSMQDCQKRSQK